MNGYGFVCLLAPTLITNMYRAKHQNYTKRTTALDTRKYNGKGL